MKKAHFHQSLAWSFVLALASACAGADSKNRGIRPWTRSSDREQIQQWEGNLYPNYFLWGVNQRRIYDRQRMR